LLLTEERVNIPLHKIAFISIKASIKLRGLINVSGFHVDPGFKGNLVFSVYNAGVTPISLEKSDPYFLIWFADLQLADNETTTYDGEHKNQSSILLKYVDPLLMAELASPNVLLEKINRNFDILDGKARTWDYILKTGMGIVIVVGLKLLLDWSVYEKGRSDGYERKQREIVADTTLSNILREQKALLIEVDSLKSDRDRLAAERERLLQPPPQKRN
jgi:dCTP deaminase